MQNLKDLAENSVWEKSKADICQASIISHNNSLKSKTELTHVKRLYQETKLSVLTARYGYNFEIQSRSLKVVWIGKAHEVLLQNLTKMTLIASKKKPTLRFVPTPTYWTAYRWLLLHRHILLAIFFNIYSKCLTKTTNKYFLKWQNASIRLNSRFWSGRLFFWPGLLLVHNAINILCAKSMDLTQASPKQKRQVWPKSHEQPLSLVAFPRFESLSQLVWTGSDSPEAYWWLYVCDKAMDVCDDRTNITGEGLKAKVCRNLIEVFLIPWLGISWFLVLYLLLASVHIRHLKQVDKTGTEIPQKIKHKIQWKFTNLLPKRYPINPQIQFGTFPSFSQKWPLLLLNWWTFIYWQKNLTSKI